MATAANPKALPMTEGSICITIRLRLRDGHAAGLIRKARAVNFVWNYCNETQRHAVRWGRKAPSAFEFHRLTAGSGAELGLHAHTVQRVCSAYTKSRDARGLPWLRWRSERRSLGWVPFNTGHVKLRNGVVVFNGVEYRPMHMDDRLTDGTKIGAGSFSCDARGRWYVNLPIDVSVSRSAPISYVGIDLGLKTLAALSDGNSVRMPAFYRGAEPTLATAQQARRSKRTRSIHAKIANRRRDFLHKASADIASRYGFIAIGDVSSAKLAKTRMAKSVLDAGWSDFKRMLSYKAMMHGGTAIEVSEAFTSQVCSECGCKPASRPRGIADLGIREWTCSECGAVHDRDVNAARNILRVGLHALAGGARDITSTGAVIEGERALTPAGRRALEEGTGS